MSSYITSKLQCIVHFNGRSRGMAGLGYSGISGGFHSTSSCGLSPWNYRWVLTCAFNLSATYIPPSKSALFWMQYMQSNLVQYQHLLLYKHSGWFFLVPYWLQIPFPQWLSCTRPGQSQSPFSGYWYFNFCRMYRIQIKMHLNATNKTVEQVLILLIESGFVYISVWVGSSQTCYITREIIWTIDSCNMHNSHKILSNYSSSNCGYRCAIYSCMMPSHHKHSCWDSWLSREPIHSSWSWLYNTRNPSRISQWMKPIQFHFVLHLVKTGNYVQYQLLNLFRLNYIQQTLRVEIVVWVGQVVLDTEKW